MIDGALLLFHAETVMVAAQALSIHQERSAEALECKGCYRFLPTLLSAARPPPPLLRRRRPVERPKRLILLPGLVAV